jgi:nucleotide-binding universal stress UspA family protein
MAGPEDVRILLATDFSAPAQRAYAYAARLATALRARVVILNVLEAPPGLDPEFPVNAVYLQQLLSESKLEMGRLVRVAEENGLRPEPRQVPGDPAACISKIAQEANATLIVMGTHGRTGWNRLLLGSAAEKVVREAPCPVLTVRVTESEEPGEFPARVRLNRLLVPIDFSECAQEAFEFAAMLARKLGVGVRLVHASEPAAYPLDFKLLHVSDEKALQARVRERLQELVSVLKDNGITAESVCELGTPTEVILTQTEGRPAERVEPADAIVMGTHGRRGLGHLALGSVAEFVVRRVACPVLTVKSPKYRTAHVSGPEREVGDAQQKG